MRILVTGGEGTLGRPLVKELRKRGHIVGVVDLKHSEDPEVRRCDVSDYRQLQEAMFGGGAAWDMVYHAAAEFGRHNGEEYYEQLWRTNAIGTKNILKFQEIIGFKLVFFSSSEVYGDYDGKMTEEVMDAMPIGSSYQKNDYAISKWVNELQIMNSVERHGLETVRVRLFNTYGPGEYYTPYRSVVSLFTYRALKQIPYQVFEGYKRTATFVDDTINTLATLADPDKFKPGSVYNIAGHQFVDIRYISDLILDECEKYGEIDRSLVEYMPEDSHNTVNKDPDCTKAKEDLGHDPQVTLEEGIPKTVKWFNDVYRK